MSYIYSMNARFQEEGDDLQKRARVIDYDGNNIDYLAFGPEDFTELKQWQILMSHDKHGIAYRLGVKDGVYDSKGDPISLFLFYSQHLVRTGETMCEQEKRALDAYVRQHAKTATHLASRITGKDIICLVIDPMPSWLQHDLEMLLDKTRLMYDP